MAQPETVQLTCPQCGREFEAPVWTVLDLGREPELRDRFLQGEINLARCPDCETQGFIPAPLAVHDPTRRRVIFLLPGIEEMNQEEQQAAVSALGNALLTELPPVERPDYLFRPIVVADPGQLAYLLSEEEEPSASAG
jgi:hypothetical protein